ncbi:hypothetical protein H4R18_005543 [Coemansia javaensis]|uniref:Transcription and mRNA export factor SUS1 n=1 Tax=Coemansia javaensis TaxID=2761396 RepID=A0A9W8H258_9FUNG|nr:hypothetical protein H4R18_005543 [Coemansia javaensis]
MSNDATGLREELLRRFIESGERERLQEILRSRLHTSGWQDRVKHQCQQVIRDSPGGIATLTVDDVAEAVTPFARESVPEAIRSEILEDIRAFVYRVLPETDP